MAKAAVVATAASSVIGQIGQLTAAQAQQDIKAIAKEIGGRTKLSIKREMQKDNQSMTLLIQRWVRAPK